MKVKKMIKSDVSTFKVGDIIKVRLTDGEKALAMAVQQEEDGMIFCLVDCLAKEYPMNETCTNEGGYEASDLRKKLNGEILNLFPAELKAMMTPFDNGDLLRLPTEKEIFGENYYGEYESPYVKQWYPKGNKPALRMQLISVTYPSLHRVCECSIIEDGVDLWARRTLDSMTAGTVEDLVETVLYVARMYERSKCFERIFVNHIQMEKSEYDVLIRHLNDPDSINDEYQISDVVFAADNTIVSVLWEGNSKDGVSGTVTLAVNGKTVYATKSTKVFCNHWVIPYNGAEYHVLVDVLPKKTVLEETIYVSKPYAERIKKYIRGAEVQGDGSSLSKTAKFSDGFEMDIRCCGGKDDSWTEAILYDNTGKEVVATEPCDGFTGCWELKDEDTNTVYRAHVMTKSNLN